MVKKTIFLFIALNPIFNICGTKQVVLSKLQIKKASVDEIQKVHTLIKDCGKALYDQYKIDLWYPMPVLEQFKCWIQNTTTYCVYANNELIATFNISLKPRKFYKPEFWHDSKAQALYLGKLAVKPDLQCKGIGKLCVQEVEKLAKGMGCTAIRFVCIQRHPWLNGFYEKLGYNQKAIVELPKPSGTVRVFEKIII